MVSVTLFLYSCDSVTDSAQQNDIQSQSLTIDSNARKAKVDVCHLDDEGNYKLLSIAGPALQAHLNHGDGLPGGDVPGMENHVFDGDCQPFDPIPGYYVNTSYDPPNCWHFVTITREDASTLKWTNSCPVPVSWTHVATDDPTVYDHGVGSPYNNNMTVEFDADGTVLWVNGPFNEKYFRQP